MSESFNIVNKISIDTFGSVKRGANESNIFIQHNFQMLDENVMLDEIEFFVCSTFVQHLEHSRQACLFSPVHNTNLFFLEKIRKTFECLKNLKTHSKIPKMLDENV